MDYKELDLHNNKLRVYYDGKVEVKKKHNDDYYEKKCCINRGYIRLSLTHNKEQKGYLVHRIVAVAFGIIPTIDIKMLIDHIDRDKSNNYLSNLRIATTQENSRNTNAKGYTFHKQQQKYQAQIVVDGKHIYLGLFDLEADAHQAYLDARIKYFGDFA